MSKLIPSNTKREDCVQTPKEYAIAITNHFLPVGNILEPCRGDGVWYSVLEDYIQHEKYPISTLDYCEILEDKDFFNYNKHVDWIITNPPYSKMRDFIKHSMELAHNIVFFTSINHLWLKARIRDINGEGFGIKEILLLNSPKEFPQSGFQMGCFYLQKYHEGNITLSNMEVQYDL